MPFYPAATIKEKLCLIELFERDGHILKRSGKEYYCLCPFHAEKNPSCHVSLEKQFFHCFGCNVGGDLIAYWQRSRQCDFKTALADLASLANITPDSSYRPASITPTKQRLPNPLLPPALPHHELKQWAEASQRLFCSEIDIQRIAEWRGLTPDIIRWAAGNKLIGLLNYGNAMREAFAVKAYTAESPHLLTVSTHIRLAPHSPMNTTAKQSWRYYPTGRGSWPFVIGNPATASQLFITEGQWDALALCQLMQWGHPHPFPDHIAVIGTRGATASTSLIIQHYPLREDQVAFLFLDSDVAGDQWLAPGGFTHQLSAKILSTYVFSPNKRGSDLNQRLKEGLTLTDLLTDTPIHRAIPDSLLTLLTKPHTQITKKK